MAAAVRTPEDLVASLALPEELLPAARAASEVFPLRVPRAWLERMARSDVSDPLLKQVLPAAGELAEQAGFSGDPLAEAAARRAPGLLQKYRGRALLVTTGACAVHCRYCFRREYPYADDAGDRLDEALGEIAADASLEEVILSGGDPLSLSNARLGALTERLGRIAHVRRLRVHTRTPIVLPARVDEGLLAWLAALPWPAVVVLHANHPAEIAPEVAAACARLRASGVTLLNQSVLLRGVNDDATVLAELSRALFAVGVLPYYLHALDPVRGAAHFALPDERARQIAGELAATLPGYLVPRLVREVAEAAAKVVLPPLLPNPGVGSRGDAAGGC
jgi:EF-P beta-lysylation protein EpmB